jgi:hypothetical protein
MTFSRTYPAYHPRAGEPTHFIEKIVGGLVANDVPGCDTPLIKSLRDSGLLSISVLNEITRGTYAQYKHHTIRAGHRWKVGDWFSPRVWSGKPYNSKQIQFAPDIQVKKVWDFEMDNLGVCSIANSGERLEYTFVRRMTDDVIFDESSLDNEIARNDGLTNEDFYFWFSRSPEFKKKGGFDGQIISWSDKIQY